MCSLGVDVVWRHDAFCRISHSVWMRTLVYAKLWQAVILLQHSNIHAADIYIHTFYPGMHCSKSCTQLHQIDTFVGLCYTFRSECKITAMIAVAVTPPIRIALNLCFAQWDSDTLSYQRRMYRSCVALVINLNKNKKYFIDEQAIKWRSVSKTTIKTSGMDLFTHNRPQFIATVQVALWFFFEKCGSLPCVLKIQFEQKVQSKII